MWAILKVLSRSPSSVEFQHISQRLQWGAPNTEPSCTGPCRTQITRGDSLPLRASSPSFSLIRVELLRRSKCPTAVWELSLPPAEQRAGVPEALPDGKVYPGVDVKLGN